MKKRKACIAAVLIAVNVAATAVATALSMWAAEVYFASMWVALPAVAAVTTYIAVRKGLNNYVAWFVPAVCFVSTHWLMVGYPPQSAGMAFLNAGIGLMASATAQVKNERELNKRNHSKEKAQ